MACRHLKLISVAISVVFLSSACSTKALKEENEALKLQIQQEEQTRQDYADKLRATEEMSEQEISHVREEMASMRSDMDMALEEALEDKQAIVNKLEDLTVIDIEHSILFQSGLADLSREGKAIVKEIAAAFNKYPGYHMRIEGHTDNLPIHENIKQRYFSNWELSAARAATVVRYMIYALDVPRNNLSIAGYADNRPIASNDTDAGRAQNRRIRAVVYKNLD